MYIHTRVCVYFFDVSLVHIKQFFCEWNRVKQGRSVELYLAPENINMCICIIYLFISDVVDSYFLDEDKSIGLV